MLSPVDISFQLRKLIGLPSENKGILYCIVLYCIVLYCIISFLQLMTAQIFRSSVDVHHRFQIKHDHIDQPFEGNEHAVLKRMQF